MWRLSSHGVAVQVAVLGDSSITAPGLADGSLSWIGRLADRLPWNVRLHSYARGGSRVNDVLLRQAPTAVVDPPDLFVVSVGVNDALHGTPRWPFRRDLGSLIDVLSCAARW